VLFHLEFICGCEHIHGTDRTIRTAAESNTRGREACPTNAVAAASPVEMIKRVCKFSLAIVLVMVVAGIIALKIAMWMRRFNV
jgi:hypothetical protein